MINPVSSGIKINKLLHFIINLARMMGFEAMTANMNDGFVEAILRSLRKGFLDKNVYSQLKVTSNIQEFKLVLEDSDYGADIFAN